MKLIPNAGAVLKRAWSVRLNLLAMGFIVAEVCLPLLKEIIPIPAWSFLVAAGIASAGAFWARFIYQPNVSEQTE